MRGYHDASYGDAFADVYDDWYADIGDVDAAVTCLAGLAPGGRALELGVGTGRVAIPLAARGLEVLGVDASAEMLGRLRMNDPSGLVRATLGDMVDDAPAGPFDVVYAAYNTLFNLPSARRQRGCFAAVASRLGEHGCFVVEAFVPEQSVSGQTRGSSVAVRSLQADRVVLSVSVDDPEEQRAEGQFIDITESSGVRLRPWSVRWATPVQLDEMAASAGLSLASRWASFDGARFDDDSARHVSVYRRTPTGRP